MTRTTPNVTVPAMVTIGGCPEGTEDCHHPGLPHISDFTSAPPWCHATQHGDARCTLTPVHDGPHVAGNGDWITAAWDPDPAHDWAQWKASVRAASRPLPVVSWVYAEGPHGATTSGGFLWWPPHERDLMPAEAVAQYRHESTQAFGGPARVRLLHVPVPAQLAEDARDPDESVRQRVTDWLDDPRRLDEVEVTGEAVADTIRTPDDPEPRVQVIVQRQYTNRRGYDVDAAEPTRHAANAALRVTPRETVAALRDNDESSDEFVLAHGWLDGHEGGFYARFEGDGPYDDESDGTPASIACWLAWADRWRHLVGQP